MGSIFARVDAQFTAAARIRSAVRSGSARRSLESDLACPTAAAAVDLLLATVSDAFASMSGESARLAAAVEALTLNIVAADETGPR